MTARAWRSPPNKVTLPMLAARQNDFMAGLLAPGVGASSAGPALADIEAGTFSAAERLAIYRNNLRENFLKVMDIEYPVIKRLVGEDFFRQTVDQYLQQAPSHSGDLFHCGRAFPDFLQREFGAGDYPYFADVAALEWAYQEAMIAADSSAVFDAQGLARIDAESYERLRLQTHPALRLVRSRYPIVTIWSANQPDASAAETIDLDRGGENALLLRPLRSTSITVVSPGAATFIEATLANRPLGAALEAALAAEAGFDLQAALASWIRDRAIVSWTLAAS